MTTMTHQRLWLCLVWSCGLVFAQTVEFRIPLDLDDDPNTGCSVVTVDGTFLGAEQILITTVDQGSMLVTDVSIADCTGAVFGAPVSVNPGGWAVGQGTGEAGSDVIETLYPMTVFNTPTGYVRAALTANEPGGGEDALLLNNGNPIRLLLFIPVPTLSQWVLILFALLLMLAALVWMRRHPNQQGLAVLFLAVASLALLGFSTGIVLDGDPSDWTMGAIASDPAGDNATAPDILAFYSCVQGIHPNAQSIYFRIDAVLNQAPSADPQMQTLLEDDPAYTITLTGMDPEGQPLTFSIDSGPANGTLSAITPLTPTSASVDYTPNADYFGADSFDFIVSDGLANSIPATVSLDITPINDIPLFMAGADVMVIKDVGPQTVSAWATGIAAGPANESAQVLTFNITNNTNPGLFAASGAPAVDPITGDLTFENEPDINGIAIITLELMDDGGTANGGMDTSAPQMFTINIGAVNDPPSFTAGSDPTVLEDAGPQTTAAWATAMSPGPPDEAGQTLTFNVTGNSNPSLFMTGPSVDGITGDLTFETALDANGSADITIELMDDGGTANGGIDTSAPQMFTINVTAVNDPPSFTVGMDETPLEDAGAQSVPSFLSAISPGPADESAQVVSFMVSNDNNGLFTTQPDIDASGTLTYETAVDANGSAMVTVTAMDDGGTANGGVDMSAAQMFNINVTAVNDEPSFIAGMNIIFMGPPTPQTEAAWATMMSPGPADESAQMLTFNVTGNNNMALFTVQPAVDAVTGDLTYTPAALAMGVATITLEMVDNGGTANGGDDTSPAIMFTMDITAVNNPPVVMGESFQSSGSQAIGNSTFEFANASAVTTPRVFVMGDVLANDTDGGDGPSPISVSAYDATSVAGATVVMNMTTGEFTYQPPLGMNLTGDTFTYTVTDGLDTAIGTVTIDVVEMVWFIDGDAVAGTGASNTPFNSIPAFMAEQGGGMMDDPEAGDRIFVYQAMSTYDAMTSGGITLLDGQILHGEGVDLIVDTSTLHAVGGNPLAVNGPVITNTSMMNGDVVTLAMDNTVQGMALQPQNSAGVGTGVVPMKGEAGQDRRSDHAQAKAGLGKVGNLILDYLLITPIGNSDGIYLSGRTGMATITNTTITGPGSGFGAALWVEVCNAITVTATDLMSSGMGWGMDLYQNDNSVFQFLGTTVLNNSIQRGVEVSSNALGTDQAVNFATLNMASTQGIALEVTDHMGTLVVPAGTIDHGGGRLCEFDNFDSGTDLSSLTITSTDHEGISIENSAGTFTFPAMTITTPPSVDAISLQNNVGATVNLGNLALTTNGTSGLFANIGGTLNIAAPNTVTINTTDDMGIDISGTAMLASFDSVTVNNATGAGINLNNNSGTTDFGLLSITNTGGTGLTATNAGTVDVTNGTSSINTTNGPAVVINPTNVGMTFATVSSSSSPAMGISLTGVTGSLTMNGGSITGSSGTAFHVDGGNGNITYSGTVNNTAGNAVAVVSRTGGTVDMLGAVTDTGAAGIVLNNNSSGGPVVNFNATVDITNSTGAAVSVTSNTGATISFSDLDIDNSASDQIGIRTSGVNAGATLSITTGTVDAGINSAVDLDNIGLGVNLVSVNSSGGAPVGIDLLDTTGSFAVIGDSSGSRNGSGGTISNKAGIGIQINRATNVTLQSIDVANTGDDGLRGGAQVMATDGIDGFVLRGCVFTDNGNAVDEHGLELRDIIGTVVIDNNRVTNSFETGVEYFNDSRVITSLTVTGNEIDNLATGAAFSFELQSGAGNPALNSATVMSNDIHDNFATGLFFVNNGGGAMNNLVIDGNTLNDNNIAIDVSMGASNNTNQFMITGNTTQRNQSHAINVFSADTAGDTSANVINAVIQGNFIGNGMVGSGSVTGTGIRVNFSDPIDAAVLIDGNDIRNVNGRGIEAVGRLGGNAGNAAFTITDNTIIKDKGTPFTGDTFAGVFVSADGNNVCANITGNTVDGDICESFGAPGFVFLGCDFLLQEIVGSSLQIESGATACSGVACTDATQHVLENNTAVNGNVTEIDGAGMISTGTSALVIPGSCDTPTP